MTEHGWERDDWPEIFEKVMAADILVITSPIWLGQKSSICMQVIEACTANHLLNDAGQYAYYGVAADHGQRGRHQALAMEILYSLGHLGFTIPPRPTPAGSARRARPVTSTMDRAGGQRLHQPQHHLLT